MNKELKYLLYVTVANTVIYTLLYHSVTYNSAWYYLVNTYAIIELGATLGASLLLMLCINIITVSKLKDSSIDDKSLNKVVDGIKSHADKNIYYIVSLMGVVSDFMIGIFMFNHGYGFSGCLLFLVGLSSILYQHSKYMFKKMPVTNSHK